MEMPQAVSALQMDLEDVLYVLMVMPYTIACAIHHAPVDGLNSCLAIVSIQLSSLSIKTLLFAPPIKLWR